MIRALHRFLLPAAFLGFCLPNKAPAQQTPQSAEIVLSSGRIKAGGSVELTVSFSPAPSFQGYAQLEFNGGQLAAGCTLPAKASSCVMKLTTAPDFTETLRATRLYYQLSKQYSITFTPVTIQVDPLDQQIVVPKQAIASLSPTIRQLFSTRADEIEVIYNGLQNDLDKRSADTPDLTLTLLTAVLATDAKIVQVEREYRKIRPASSTPFPIAFEDVHLHYLATEVELRNQLQQGTIASMPYAHLETVQLKQRPESSVKSREWALYGTKSARVTGILIRVQEGLGLLRRLADTGSETFTLALRSRPSGARIFYKLASDSDYRDWSKPSDDLNAELPLGLWTFRFQSSDGCTATRSPDPLIETKPDLDVELVCRH